MSDDNWFRFPLALLAYKPNDPLETLYGILHYSLWTVGDSTTAKEIEDSEADAYGDKNNMHFKRQYSHRRLLRGAKILHVSGGNCDSMYGNALAVETFLEGAGSAAANKVNLNSELFWRAVDTVRDDGKMPELSWRNYRLLCALLSKIGSRKFDRCGWQELQARAAGWCGKSGMAKSTPAERKRRAPLVLTVHQIRAIRDELEANNFFCRVKYRTGGKGNGGESWYSFSTKTGDEGRAELLGWITDKKQRMRGGLEAKRAQDLALIANHQPTANPPPTLIAKRLK